jgi:two-component system osmolarity sensor histidine kinase EnvZ
MYDTAISQLGVDTRVAGTVNGQTGIWVSFSIDNAGEDDYWLMLPGQHAERDFPWHWLGWGAASLALALLVAWLIVSRVTLPLRNLANLAGEVGRGKHPDPIPERGALELRQLAEIFNRMSDNLKRINAERAEVLAGISHDLRTPLTRLRLELEMSINDENIRNAVIEDVEQMDDIIAQFLDYARGESGEPAEISDINALVTQVAGTQGRSSTPPQITLGELPPTLIYRQALTRAIANLLENSRKYGGNERAIETRVSGNEILIDILDRGPGIPEAEVERLKRPFTRLENARTNASGTGLGLAIVERIAGLHEGTLRLLPREGGGLIARLSLPLKTK